jgi:hypothetical protein
MEHDPDPGGHSLAGHRCGPGINVISDSGVDTLHQTCGATPLHKYLVRIFQTDTLN